jgi:hypothetical protein
MISLAYILHRSLLIENNQEATMFITQLLSNVNQFLMTIATSLFLLGLLMMAAGIWMLVKRVMGNELKQITQQTTRLAQKGITEDVAGLVGNAGQLVEALNSLVKTASGVGIFLNLAGFLLILASYYIASQIR